MKTKTIILSNPNNDINITGRGILSFYIEDDLLLCKLRLYNLAPLDRYAKLAIYHQDQVYSANLLERNGCFETSLVGNFDIEQDFYSAVIDTTNNNNILIAGGTYAGFFFENLNQELSSQDNEENTISTEEHVDICDDCSNCTNCKYKQFFYEYNQENQPDRQSKITHNTVQPEEQSIGSHIEEKITETLLDNIAPQFDFIFEKYPLNQELSNLIENSKFVELQENSQCFSIGAIYENDEIKYICYAVKSSYNQPAPAELGEHYQWLPIDPQDPLSDGYYLVFQDIVDLKIVEL